MRTLVIADCHNRWRTVNDCIERHKDVDKIIFGGDVFDNFGETKEDIEQTAEYLCRWLANPKFIWLLANHDAFYAFPKVSYLRCSGNTHEKAKLIREIVGNDIYNFQLYHWDEYFLYTHAGLHPRLLPIQGFSPEWMEKRCQEALNNVKAGIIDPFLVAGQARGGWELVGGITWLDWHEEFEPIEGLNQIVFHTPGRIPKTKLGTNSVNFCLDTHNQHYSIITGGKVKLYNADGSDYS